MGLFQRKTATLSEPLYSLGNQDALIVAGLGNPGKQYENTRHNLGFKCIDEYAASQEFTKWKLNKDLKAEIASKNEGSLKIILIKPSTFMNASGEALSLAINFFKVKRPPIVVHDELDVNFGQIRITTGGGDAGHNGVRSIVEHIGPDFGRVRIGIGPKTPVQIDSADFVLGKFNDTEQKHLTALKREVCAILSELVFSPEIKPETRSFI